MTTMAQRLRKIMPQQVTSDDLDAAADYIDFLEQAINSYECALKAAFPQGGSGEIFDYWNEARGLTS